MKDPTGTFSPVFESAHGYLGFLNLRGPDAKKLVSLVIKCSQSREAPQAIRGMLHRPNWRPHLVAAVALSVISYEEETFEALWRAFDGGSWVAPQLAAVASLRDPDFSGQARLRIQSRCRIHMSQISSALAAERDGPQGPESVMRRSAKAAASLIRLVQLLPPQPAWLATELSSPELLELLEEDTDDCGKNTEEWLRSLTKILASLGVAVETSSAE